MAIVEELRQEKLKLVKVVQGNKLGKKITSQILNPILDALADGIPGILDKAGREAINHLMANIQSSVPGDSIYRIYELDTKAPKGQKTSKENSEVYIPSLQGLPPLSKTGSLVDSIEYKVDLDGFLTYGILKQSTGKEFESYSYFPGKIYVDIGGENTRTDVGVYSNALEEKESSLVEKTWGLSKHGYDRPWFKEILDDYLREHIRDYIHEQINILLKKTTRRISVRRAIIFKVYFRKV